MWGNILIVWKNYKMLFVHFGTRTICYSTLEGNLAFVCGHCMLYSKFANFTSVEYHKTTWNSFARSVNSLLNVNYWSVISLFSVFLLILNNSGGGGVMAFASPRKNISEYPKNVLWIINVVFKVENCTFSGSSNFLFVTCHFRTWWKRYVVCTVVLTRLIQEYSKVDSISNDSDKMDKDSDKVTITLILINSFC